MVRSSTEQHEYVQSSPLFSRLARSLSLSFQNRLVAFATYLVNTCLVHSLYKYMKAFVIRNLLFRPSTYKQARFLLFLVLITYQHALTADRPDLRILYTIEKCMPLHTLLHTHRPTLTKKRLTDRQRERVGMGS